jgi:hypothetical protein
VGETVGETSRVKRFAAHHTIISVSDVLTPRRSDSSILPEDMANQSVRLKEEQLRREEEKLRDIELKVQREIQDSLKVLEARLGEWAEGIDNAAAVPDSSSFLPPKLRFTGRWRAERRRGPERYVLTRCSGAKHGPYVRIGTMRGSREDLTRRHAVMTDHQHGGTAERRQWILASWPSSPSRSILRLLGPVQQTFPIPTQHLASTLDYLTSPFLPLDATQRPPDWSAPLR